MSSYAQSTSKKPRNPQQAFPWPVRWPEICRIMHEMDHLFHGQVPPSTPQDPGASMVNWLLV
ncbi:hypothetical protein BD408DRAFT_360552 [Parasitella parasitica]|nr:hypothetical protein BD408DRAFT_360552 [Parasitella parasitica]